MEHPGGDVSASELVNKLELVSQTLVYTSVLGLLSIFPHRNVYRQRRGSSWITDTILTHDTLLCYENSIGKSSYLIEVWFGSNNQLLNSSKADVLEKVFVIE